MFLHFFQDKKSLESVCLCMARLVDNYQSDEKILKEIAADGFLANIQQLVSRSVFNFDEQNRALGATYTGISNSDCCEILRMFKEKQSV